MENQAKIFYEAFRVAAVHEDDYIRKVEHVSKENKKLKIVEQDYKSLKSKYS